MIRDEDNEIAAIATKCHFTDEISKSKAFLPILATMIINITGPISLNIQLDGICLFVFSWIYITPFLLTL